MTTYSKLNIIYRLQKWMDSVPGQTFLNYAYSWGASIVILGTLFKLTHLPGANFFLFLGMGTEVFVFFISAFDRPFDKTTDGMNLDLHLAEEGEEGVSPAGVANAVQSGAAVAGGGTIVINGGGGVPAAQVPADMAEELKDATSNYVDELNRLTEMLQKVSEQSQRLTRDSEEMENLNRTLTGISRVYEMQLKSASAQISTIDEINEQTRHMAEQIVELNKIYARMIEAMQVRANI